MITHFLALGIAARQSAGPDLVAVDLVTDAASVGLPELNAPGMPPATYGFGRPVRFNVHVPPRRVHACAAANAVTDPATFGLPALTRSFARNDAEFWALAEL